MSSSIIPDLEKKLNKSAYFKRFVKPDYCKVSTSQYWDWLRYIDVSSA
jgi:hypothetical protein